MPPSKQPNPTSMAVLGLLALRSWTGYELTVQVTRTLGRFWPRAESNLYGASKALVDQGLARSRRSSVGRRERTTYTITAAGRRALARWVAAPARGPALEFEGLVKVFFAEHGTRQDLLAHLRTARQEADATLRDLAASAERIAGGDIAFPERQAQNTLVFRFVWAQTVAVRDWAVGAIAEVETWADDPAAWPHDLAACLREIEGSLMHRQAGGPP